jgi:FkbM family methyltransferase
MKLLKRLAISDRLLSAPIVVAGRTFLSPKVESYICEIREPWMPSLLGRLLPLRHGTFLDVGMNLGQTLVAVKAVEPSRAYVGVEPNPLCVAYCERLIALNGLSDCTIVPAGLASGAGLRKLHLYHGTSVDSSASLVEDFRPRQPISHVKFVAVVPFSEIVRALPVRELAVLKIDIEGGESEVLASMCAELAAWRPWIIVEILPCYDSSNADRLRGQDRIEQQMREADYRILRIMKSREGQLLRLEPIETIGIHGDLTLCDYVLCPSEAVAPLMAATST